MAEKYDQIAREFDALAGVHGFMNAAELSEILDELKVAAVTLKIAEMKQYDGTDGLRWAAHWNEEVNALILNNTNNRTLSKAYGRDVRGWVGKDVELKIEETEMNGKSVNGIRLYPVSEATPPSQPPRPTRQPLPEPATAPAPTPTHGVPARSTTRSFQRPRPASNNPDFH